MTHLINTYCLPTILYGCTLRTLTTFVFTELMLHGTVVLEELLDAVGEIVLNLYSIFTTLHGMQTRSSDENSVCPSVCQMCDL